MHWYPCATTLSNEYTSDRKYYSVFQGLTDIPTDIPAHALEVYIRGNTIDKIKADTFSDYLNVQDLIYNTIE